MTRLQYILATFWWYNRIVYKKQSYNLDKKIMKREFVSRIIAGLISISPIIILNELDFNFSYLIIVAFIASTIGGQIIRALILPKDIDKYLHKIEKGE